MSKTREQINIRQFKILVILYTIGTSLLIVPSPLAAASKQDAWIGAIVGIAINTIVVWIYTRFGRLLEQTSFVGLCRSLLGRAAGSGLAGIYIFFWFMGSVTLMFYVGDFLTTQVMVETPIQSIHMLFILIVVMAVRLGIETTARAAEIFFPWFLLLFAALAIFLAPEMSMNNMLPMLEATPGSLFNAGLGLAGSSALTLSSFFMVYPSIRQPNRMGSAFLSASLIGGLFIFLISLICITVLGAELTDRYMYPSYALAKKISVGRFVQRVEILIAALWFISIFFKLTLYFYACLSAMTELLRARDHRPFVLPMGMIIVVMGQVVYPNVSWMMDWDATVWVPMALVLGFLVPLFLLLLARLRQKRQNRAG